MEAGVARIGDMWYGICCCHSSPIPMSGVIITGSPNVRANGIKESRCTDITIGFCGHTGFIVTCSPTVKINSLGRARCGDMITGCNIGVIITCSGNVR